jgi:hypothetical protein
MMELTRELNLVDGVGGLAPKSDQSLLDGTLQLNKAPTNSASFQKLGGIQIQTHQIHFYSIDYSNLMLCLP